MMRLQLSPAAKINSFYYLQQNGEGGGMILISRTNQLTPYIHLLSPFVVSRIERGIPSLISLILIGVLYHIEQQALVPLCQ